MCDYDYVIEQIKENYPTLLFGQSSYNNLLINLHNLLRIYTTSGGFLLMYLLSHSMYCYVFIDN